MTPRFAGVLLPALVTLLLTGCAEGREQVRLLGSNVARASSGHEGSSEGAVLAAPAVATDIVAASSDSASSPVVPPPLPDSAPWSAPVAPPPVVAEAPVPVPQPELPPEAVTQVAPVPWWPEPPSYVPVATVAPLIEPTWTPYPTATPPPTPTPDFLLNAGPPAQIEIPAIGVVALVEHVGLTTDGAMATPRGWMNVAWFSQGFRPGEAGNSVIAGHLDSRSGGPAVFWDLNRLQPGDEIVISYQNGDRYTFAVQDLEVVPYDVAGDKVSAIFGPSQTSDLNLITCNGDWDRGKATYTQRLVVYSTLLPEKTVRSGYQGAYD